MSEYVFSDSTFEAEVLKSEQPVLVDFFATWCGPCKMLEPVFAGVASEMKDKIKFGKVDVDDNQELSQRFHVMSIPTLVFLDDREVVNKVSGVLSAGELKKAIEDSFK